MTHRDCLQGASGRRRDAGDAEHRPDLSTPSVGSCSQLKRRLCTTFGLRPARLPMPSIAAPHAPIRKTRKDASMSHYRRSLA